MFVACTGHKTLRGDRRAIRRYPMRKYGAPDPLFTRNGSMLAGRDRNGLSFKGTDLQDAHQTRRPVGLSGWESAFEKPTCFFEYFVKRRKGHFGSSLRSRRNRGPHGIETFAVFSAHAADTTPHTSREKVVGGACHPTRHSAPVLARAAPFGTKTVNNGRER